MAAPSEGGRRSRRPKHPYHLMLFEENQGMNAVHDRAHGCRAAKTAGKWVWRTVALVLAWASPPEARAQQPAAQPATASLVFEGVTVIDVEQGKHLADQRVVVTGNRIAAVGDAMAVKVPEGARVVDAKGKYLIPGLWDMHTHSRYLTDVFYPLFLANGVTGIRDAWSEIPLDTLLRWRREILAGTRVGPPRQLLVGRALSDDDSAAAQYGVDSLKAAGADMIKTYPFTYSLAAAARHAGMLFGGHLDFPAMD